MARPLPTLRGRVVDNRTRPGRPKYGWVVGTDEFLSGWGEAEGGRSFYVLAVDTQEEADVVRANFRARPEMKHVRLVSPSSLNGALLPGPNDVITLSDRGNSPRWYEPGAFGTRARNPVAEYCGNPVRGNPRSFDVYLDDEYMGTVMLRRGAGRGSTETALSEIGLYIPRGADRMRWEGSEAIIEDVHGGVTRLVERAQRRRKARASSRST